MTNKRLHLKLSIFTLLMAGVCGGDWMFMTRENVSFCSFETFAFYLCI